MNEIATSAVQFSSTVTVRVFDDSTPTLYSHICPTAGSTRPPQPASTQIQAGVASDMMTRANSDISNDRKVQRRVSIAAVLSFQNYLRKRCSSDSSTDADLLQEVASRFSQRARDLALERARLTYCEVYQPVKGTAPTIPVQISKYPSFKRKSDASESQNPTKRRLTLP
jgi:hypothetical protein